jgi:iron complex transport system substrate-binding protein
MKNLFLLAVLSCLFSSANAACDVIDGSGQHVRLSQPAQRIISLAPDITEMVFAMGAGGHLVGVMQGSDYPLAAKTKPVVGSYHSIDIEKIISLHPDLIITWSTTFSRSLSVIKRLGIPVYVSDPHRLEDIPHTMKQLGCLTGMENTAQDQARYFLQELNRLRMQYEHAKSIRVFYQIGAYSLITVNKNSWINEVISLCGGQNVFANARFAAPEMSWEAVVSANPQVIVTDAQMLDWKQRWQRWPQIAAVKQQHLYAIHPDLIERASPRLLQGVSQMCVALDAARKG